MARVVAVVCSYWKERRDNAARIIQDLLAGYSKPDHIILLDNNPDVPRGVLLDAAASHAKVSVVEGANWECRGKFVAALLDPADYYLLMDDDTSVGTRTLTCFLSHAHRGCVFGYWGVRLVGDSFMNGQIIQPSTLTEEVMVDAFHGRGMFVAFDALVRMFALEERVRLEYGWRSEGDDLIVGLANQSSMIPMQGPEAFVDLDPGSEAMQNAPGYFDMRDDFLRTVLKVRAEHPAEWWGE